VQTDLYSAARPNAHNAQRRRTRFLPAAQCKPDRCADKSQNITDISTNTIDIFKNSIDISTNLNDILSLLRTEVEFLPSHSSVFSPQVLNLSRGEDVVFRRFAFLFDE